MTWLACWIRGAHGKGTLYTYSSLRVPTASALWCAAASGWIAAWMWSQTPRWNNFLTTTSTIHILIIFPLLSYFFPFCLAAILLHPTAARNLLVSGFTVKVLNAVKGFPLFIPLVGTAAGNLMPFSTASSRGWENLVVNIIPFLTETGIWNKWLLPAKC